MSEGRLKVYFGYAAGVGKTWRMLDEAQDLKRKGVDVVVGYFEPHGRQDTIEKAAGLEFVPRRRMEHRGAVFEEMDAEAILRRNPRVCVVDELAHTNVPGSDREKRWQDVLLLLEHGIDVLTSVNVQHLESLNDEIRNLTGVRVRETLPDWVMDRAGEVLMVDLTPEALRNRLLRGVVYAPEKARQAMDNFFTEPNLRALREMALRHAAHALETRLAGAKPVARSQEAILLCLTARPTAAMLIRRGKRVADYLGARCLAVHVAPGRRDRLAEPLERHLHFARNLHIDVHVIENEDVAAAIADFAHQHAITQIFMGRSAARRRLFRRSTMHRLVPLVQDLEVTIVAEQRR